MKKILSGVVMAFVLSYMLMLQALAADDVLVFDSPTYIKIADRTEFIVSGYFNSDSNIDIIAIGNSITSNFPFYVHYYSVLLGDGNGGFTKNNNVTSGVVTGIEVGDFNKDGKLDFVYSLRDNNLIQIEYGNGDGSFTKGKSYPVTKPQEFTVGDFDKNGYLDVAVGSADANGNGMYLFMGKEKDADDNIFDTPIKYMSGIKIDNVFCGDYNHDGYLDLAAMSKYPGGVYILLNDKAGNFIESQIIKYAENIPMTKFASGDLNGDIYSDLVCYTNGGYFYTFVWNVTSGTFDRKYFQNNDLATTSIDIIDLNGDAKSEIVATDYGKHCVVIYPVSNGITIGAPININIKAGYDPRDLVCLDFDKDGAIDFATAGYCGDVAFLRNITFEKLISVQLSDNENKVGTLKDIKVTVATKNVADGTSINAFVLNSDGSALSQSVFGYSTITSNQAVINLTIPETLPAGKYIIKVEFTAGAKNYSHISQYTVFNYGKIVWTNNNLVVNEKDGVVSVTVKRDKGSKGSIELTTALTGTAVSGTDYTIALPLQDITFADGVDNQSYTYNFTIINNDVYTGDRSIILTVTQKNAQGEIIPDGLPAIATITIKDDDICTVTFDKNGGDIDSNPTTKTVNKGESIDILPTEPTRTGHTFTSWNTQANGSGTLFDLTTIVSEDKTVYAQWSKKSYSVSVASLNGGAITLEKSTVEYGEAVKFTITPDSGMQLKAGTLKYTDIYGNHNITSSEFLMPASDVVVSAIFELTDAKKVEKDKETMYIRYMTGDSANAVTQNLELPLNGSEYGSEITWSSNNPAVISNSGIVSRPNYTSVDAKVTLTANIRYNGAIDTRVFDVTVLKFGQIVYNISIDTITGGSIIAPTTVEAGALINLIIIPDAGYRLKLGTLKYNDGTDHVIDGNSFIMPASNVAISVEFELIAPVLKDEDKIDADKAALNIEYKEGDSANGVTQNLILPTTGIVYGSSITWSSNNSAVVSDSGIVSRPVYVRGDANVTLTARVCSGSAISTKAFNVIVLKLADQIPNPITPTEPENTVNVKADANKVESIINRTTIIKILDKKIDTFTVSTPFATLTFGAKTLSTMSNRGKQDIQVAVSKVDVTTLSDQVKQAVGNHPVFRFSVTSGDKIISQFDEDVTVSIPYTPKAGEDVDCIVIYYINAEGKLEIVSNCVYNSATGTVTFKANHFSEYAIGYNKINFKDVDTNAWYAKAVNFVAARGITIGTGNGIYSPESKLTRGQFLVMLMKAYGIKPSEKVLDNFADAGDTYYTGYLAEAKRLGITAGVGNNMYAPELEISRQEMFTLLYNTLKSIGKLPVITDGKSLIDFSDMKLVAPWAKDAITLFVKMEIINNDKLSPLDMTNRAQLAQALYMLLSK